MHKTESHGGELFMIFKKIPSQWSPDKKVQENANGKDLFVFCLKNYLYSFIKHKL